MQMCSFCSGTLDPATRRCQQCGRFPAMPPLPASATGRDSTYLQLGLGRGEGYLDFDLEIGQGQRGVYPLQVLRSPVGVVSGQLRFPFDEPTLKQALLELQNALLRASQPRRHVVSSEDAVVQRFGQRLFEALFPEEVRRRYRLSQQEAAEKGKGLRLRLTYRQYRDEANRLVKGLLAPGIEPGEHVAVWAPNVPEWALLQMALAKIGAVMVTVNTAYRAAELEYVLRQGDVTTLFLAEEVRGNDYLDSLNSVVPELAHLADPLWNSVLVSKLFGSAA